MPFIDKIDLVDAYIGKPWKAEYQEVEYIQSTGTQYIDTWVVGTFSSSIKTDYKFVLTQTKSWWQQSIFWDVGSSWQWLTIYWDANSNNQWTWCGSWTGWYPWNITVWSTTIISAIFNKGSWRTFVINWTIYTSTVANNADATSKTNNFCIFCDDRSTTLWYFKVYYFKIIKDWTLVRDFIPCYRKSDSVIWLYDIVNDTFYTNSWTWTFTKWPDVS